MFCTGCGKNIEESIKFCPYCGEKISAEAELISLDKSSYNTSGENTVVENVTAENNFENSREAVNINSNGFTGNVESQIVDKAKKGISKNMIIGLSVLSGAVILVLIIGAVIFFGSAKKIGREFSEHYDDFYEYYEDYYDEYYDDLEDYLDDLKEHKGYPNHKGVT